MADDKKASSRLYYSVKYSTDTKDLFHVRDSFLKAQKRLHVQSVGGCHVCHKKTALDFVHHDPSTRLFYVAQWPQRLEYNEQDLIQEIQKTTLYCKMHRRIYDVNRQENTNETTEQYRFVIQSKLNGQCKYCSKYPVTQNECQSFLYRYPYPQWSSDLVPVQKMVNQQSSIDDLTEAINKSVIVCLNCKQRFDADFKKQKRQQNQQAYIYEETASNQTDTYKKSTKQRKRKSHNPDNLDI
jgi:hypothetical protein